MTQRTWKTTDGWKVLTGWHRPLQHYFLQISRPCSRCNGDGVTPTGPGGTERECMICGGRGEEFLFDNLDSKNPLTDPMGGMSQAQVFAALTATLTEWPDQVMAVLGYDKNANLGNSTSDFGMIGAKK